MRIGRHAAMVIGLGMATALVAQTVPDDILPSTAGLDLPENLQIFGNVDPNVRKPTAIVNRAVITGTDVDHRLNMLLSLQFEGAQLTKEQLDQFRLQVVRGLIDETLQIQEAAANEIAVTPEEILQGFTRVSRNLERSPEEMRDWLRANGSSEQSLARQIEADLAWNRLLSRRVTPFINVGNEEVQAILDRLEAAKGTQEFHVKEIFLRSSPERADEIDANAQKMLEQMRAGAPFEYFASNFSEATTRSAGGDLGWIRPGILPAALDNALERMQVGQVVGPVDVPGGISILYLVDRRQVLTADPRDARLSLRQLTLRFPDGTTQAQATSRASEFAEATKAIQGCGNVTTVAGELNAEVVDNDAVVVRDLPPALQEMMTNMQVGQVTPPFGTAEDGVRVLVLCGRDDSSAASNMPSADRVQDSLERERVNLRAQRMLRDLRRDAVVEYR